MWYKNDGIVSRTYYGVEFKPGEIKESPGYIDNPNFILVKELESNVKPSPRSAQPRKETSEEPNIVDEVAPSKSKRSEQAENKLRSEDKLKKDKDEEKE